MSESDLSHPPEPTFSRRIGHPDRRKVLAVAVASLAIVASAAVAMGASPEPTTSGSTPSEEPAASASPRPAQGWPDFGGGVFGGGIFEGKLGFGVGPGDAIGQPGIVRLGGVEITAIDGSDLSLETVDGWTRTITVTSETEITRGGDTIAADDLAVGDSIRFRQQRNDDGTFTITRIDVVLPHVAGTVTAKSASTITIEQRDGTSVTVHVDASTTFRVEGAAGAADLDDVDVGMRILATGELNANGSLDASRVLAGTGRLRDGHRWKNAPDASSEPG